MTRIAVTGIGCISALGHSYQQFQKQLFDGYCGVAPITLFDNSKVNAKHAAEVRNFVESDHFNDKKQM